MKKITSIFILISFIAFNKSFAQPFADILSFNYQTFNATYKDSNSWKNKTDNYALNFFLPKEFKNGHTLLVRLNSETINSTFYPDSSYSSRLSSVSLPIGIKLVTKNKKWETILLAIPKIASDFRDDINSTDFQYGGVFLQHFVPNNKLKIKAGVYYNKEPFGNFFIALVGVDWKINDRINMYGIIPTNYKVEFNIIKNKLYTGVNLKYLTRSFRLSQSKQYDYVRYDEAQIKLFIDYFVYKKILLFGEVGYSIGTNPIQYKFKTKETFNYSANPIYSPAGVYPLFNIGIAYRVRLDLTKEQKNNE